MNTVNLKWIFPKCSVDIKNIPLFPLRKRKIRDYFHIAEIAYENLITNKLNDKTECFVLTCEDDPSTGYFGVALLDLRILSASTNKHNIKHRIIFAHRGTDSILDVTTADVSIFRQEIPLQFSNASRLVTKTFKFLGLSTTKNSIDIIHTGHSLGAALAQMCAHCYSHKSIGFETPGTGEILKKINPGSSINDVTHASFVMEGSMISSRRILPHRGKVFSCLARDPVIMDPISNISLLHKMKNMNPCFNSTGDFIKYPEAGVRIGNYLLKNGKISYIYDRRSPIW